MTKILCSCRVMYGRNNFLKYFILGLAGIAIMTVGGAIKLAVTEESFFHGFIDGFCTSFCGIMNIVAAEMLILGAFGAVRRVYPGYKYFHAVADGFSHFKRALLLANITGLILIMLYAAVGMIFFRNVVLLSMILAALLVIGWCDLVGSSKHQWLAVVGFLMAGFSFGFISGLFDEDTFELSLPIAAAALGTGAVLYIVCLIFALSKAEKFWTREER